MQRFGEKLRALRKQRGMTLEDLAVALGLATHSHLSNIEVGRKQPSLELAIKIVNECMPVFHPERLSNPRKIIKACLLFASDKFVKWQLRRCRFSRCARHDVVVR